MEKRDLFPVKEKSIEKYFCDEVEKVGGITIKLGQDGWQDRLVLVAGYAWFVELKRPGHKLRKLQELRKKQLMKVGFTAWMCDTKQLVDDFIYHVKVTLHNADERSS